MATSLFLRFLRGLLWILLWGRSWWVNNRGRSQVGRSSGRLLRSGAIPAEGTSSMVWSMSWKRHPAGGEAVVGPGSPVPHLRLVPWAWPATPGPCWRRLEGIPLADALAQLAAEIASHSPTLYVGHNVSFDRPIVLHEYERIPLRENLSSLPAFCTMKGTTYICRLPRRLGRGYKWPTLQELHRHLFGQSHASAHDAESDVRATAKCYFALLKRGLITGPVPPNTPRPLSRTVVFRCPSCRQSLRFPYRGEAITVRCPSCQSTFSYFD